VNRLTQPGYPLATAQILTCLDDVYLVATGRTLSVEPAAIGSRDPKAERAKYDMKIVRGSQQTFQDRVDFNRQCRERQGEEIRSVVLLL